MMPINSNFHLPSDQPLKPLNLEETVRKFHRFCHAERLTIWALPPEHVKDLLTVWCKINRSPKDRMINVERNVTVQTANEDKTTSIRKTTWLTSRDRTQPNSPVVEFYEALETNPNDKAFSYFGNSLSNNENGIFPEELLNAVNSDNCLTDKMKIKMSKVIELLAKPV